VSINDLVSIVEDIAGIQLKREYDLSAPQGVRGRNSDNTLIQEQYSWEPNISLREGLEKTYAWVYDNVRKDLGE
jgi:GDP-D-mannose 3',5'-epimerase